MVPHLISSCGDGYHEQLSQFQCGTSHGYCVFEIDTPISRCSWLRRLWNSNAQGAIGTAIGKFVFAVRVVWDQMLPTDLTEAHHV